MIINENNRMFKTIKNFLINSFLQNNRIRKLILISEETMGSLPSHIEGLPDFYAFTKDGIKIWPRQDAEDVNLYWGLNYGDK